MHWPKFFGLRPVKSALSLTLGLVGLSVAGLAAASARSGLGLGPLFGFGHGFGAVANVEGEWRWREHTLIVLPGEVAMLYFGVADPEGPVMILFCVSEGDMTVTQAGADFSGFATQSSWCRTLGGQSAATPPFPPGFGVSGTIHGHLVSFSADVGDGIDCSYHGVVRAWFGEAFAVNAAGGCDVPAPFKPNISKSLSFDMYRH